MKDQLMQPYGNLTEINTCRMILDAVGEDVLADIAGDYLDLLGTSFAIYEKNGNYALGIFSSGWCRILDVASRKLCRTDDNKEALGSGKWLCHESCWTNASKVSIETGQPVDIQCKGGLRLYAIPIRAGEEIIGSINFGYGDPPKDLSKLEEVAEYYGLPIEKIQQMAQKYDHSDPFLISNAKKRLLNSANLIGMVFERKQMEEGLTKAKKLLEQQVAERTAELTQANKQLREEIAERSKTEELFRKSEERYRCITTAVTDYIYTVRIENGSPVETIHGPACIGVTGYSPEEFRENPCLWINMVYEEDRDVVKEHALSIMDGKEPTEIEHRIVRRDGMFRWVSNRTVPHYDNHGKLTSYDGLIKDITERNQLEDQLRQSQKMEAIGTLAGGIAHDFNNILAGIFNYTQIAYDNMAEDGPSKDMLKEILVLGRRARDLIKQIMLFSRKSREDLRPMNPHLVINEALKMLRETIPTTIEIRHDIDKNCGMVIADPTQIHQVLINLSANAAQAMKEYGGVLEITLSSLHLDKESVKAFPDFNPGGYVKLTVNDTGPGIDPEIIDRIFDPFFSTKGVGEGTGMGLAVVHGIVKNHGGAITVESEPGKGTIFNILLPQVEEVIQETKKKIGTVPTGSENILFVDDEESMVYTIKIILEGLGYNVTTTMSSPEALEIFRNEPDKFDLVITDLTLPNMTGIRLAEELIRIQPDIPVVLTTGFGNIIKEDKLAHIGVKTFMSKPFEKSEIAKTIRMVLDTP